MTTLAGGILTASSDEDFAGEALKKVGEEKEGQEE